VPAAVTFRQGRGIPSDHSVSFDILDLLKHDDRGRGMVNLLHADQLMDSPSLYAVFLLFLLTELFRKLPEAGDLDKPKLVFSSMRRTCCLPMPPNHCFSRLSAWCGLSGQRGVAFTS
jgi:hypothetical protein